MILTSISLSRVASVGLLALGLLGACSTPPKKQKPPTQKTVRTISHTTAGGSTTGGPLDQSAPTDAELAGSPCSNPAWAKPPPGATTGGAKP